jgi:hypothetical protein
MPHAHLAQRKAANHRHHCLSARITARGCGGESQTFTIDPHEQAADPNAEPRSGEPLVSTTQAAFVRLQAVRLQSHSWATVCENRQITTLQFTPAQLTTDTVFYKDDNCLEVRQEMRRSSVERYVVGTQVIDATGVVAIEIHFKTVLSDRYDRFVIENGRLYFGQRQAQASYRTEAIDFQVPYLSANVTAASE